MNPDAPLPPAMNHVFVDFENVHEPDLSIIGQKAVTFILLLGARQTKLDVALVEKMMQNVASVQLIRLTSSGKNALDFTLAYYLGRAVVTDPTGYFHIVSKDTGYDALIEHLKSRHIRAHRHDDFSTLPFSHHSKVLAAPTAAPVSGKDDLLDRALVLLRKSTNNRPKKMKTLSSQLLSHLKPATGTQIAGVIEKLRKDEHISISEKEAVSYHL